MPEHDSYTFDIDADKTDWILYENEEYGFAFQHSPNAEVKELTQEDFDSKGWGNKTHDVFSLQEDAPYRHWIPTVSVMENKEGVGVLEQLDRVVYQYTVGVSTTEIDGRPAFWECTGEGGGCSGYVVTENFIFRLGGITNIEFDEDIVGPSELAIVWPERVEIPAY